MSGQDEPEPVDAEGGHGLLYRIGARISAVVADLAAHPAMQVGFILLCVGWFLLGLETNILTAALSILAITLTQMVLNQQNEREAEAHRRDVAMHAKLDELLVATGGARNHLAGIEKLSEKKIEELRPDGDLAEATDEPGEAYRRLPGEREPEKSRTD